MRRLAMMATLALLCGALSFGAAPASAQSPASGAKPKLTATEKKARAAECSAQADKQGLHGEARKTFRSKCKRGQS